MGLARRQAFFGPIPRGVTETFSTAGRPGAGICQARELPCRRECGETAWKTPHRRAPNLPLHSDSVLQPRRNHFRVPAAEVPAEFPKETPARSLGTLTLTPGREVFQDQSRLRSLVPDRRDQEFLLPFLLTSRPPAAAPGRSTNPLWGGVQAAGMERLILL